EKLLKSIPVKDKRVILSGKIGEDVAVIEYPDRFLAVKIDPITLTGKEIGWYVVNINANDIVTSGAVPRFFLVTALLPEKKTDERSINEIFDQIKDACDSLDITLCGGHTEITASLKNPILVGTMLGEGEKNKMLTTSGAKVGDDILLTKGIAVEATSIISREKEKFLLKKYSSKFIERCKGFLYEPGISVVKDALIANKAGGVHSMHDPTEGGIATGLLEIAKAAKVGLMVEEERIKILEETHLLAEEFGIDPLGVIASGSLLITCNATSTPRITKALKESGIDCFRIGRITESCKGIKMRTTDNRVTDLSAFKRDEIVKIY
ncbi:MAG TPA: hydrogenase expression/formation protein, partial [Candidatus Omnitrophica bacterium]|nr:hydrogenase expression/formation protein [Candidatus Omnitrophota bacterium]